MKHKSEEEKVKALEKLRVEHLEAQIKERDAESKNFNLLDRCVKAYEVAVIKSLDETSTSLDQSQMSQIHESAKTEVTSMVCNLFWFVYFSSR